MAETGARVAGNSSARPAAAAPPHRGHGAGHHAARQGGVHRDDFIFLPLIDVVGLTCEHAECDGGNGSVHFLVLHSRQRRVCQILMAAERLPLALVQWTVVTSSLVDGLFIAGMALITGGLDSILFWLFRGFDHPQCRQRAAGVFPVDFEFRHQPVLRAGGRVWM